jgi:hypothetical protein
MTEHKRLIPSAWQLAAIAAILPFVSAVAIAQTNVDVVNTPSVRVVNPVLRVGGSVTIANPATFPVPVAGNVNATVTGSVDAQGSARAAVSGACDVNNLYPSGTGYCTLATVAPGQILVIESISCFAHLPTGVPFEAIGLQLQAPVPGVGVTTVNHFLPLTPAPNGNYGGVSAYALLTPIKLYAFGPTLASGGGPVSVSIGVQAGPLPSTNAAPSFGCSMAGVLESQ